MNTASLLQALQARVDQLAQVIAPIGHQRTSKARFDSVLFHTHGRELRDYMSEVQTNLQQLKQSAGQGHSERVAFLAERLVAQLTALQREMATADLRKKEPPAPAAENYYQKLATHKDYERRLQAMLKDRESQLATQHTLAAQQKLQREMAALEGRLQRCRQALIQIERKIERQEHGLG